MKTLVLSVLFTWISWGAIAGENPTKAVSGKVYDKNTHEVLAGVKVTLENSNQSVYTDLNGQFTLLVNSQEPATLKFSGVGYSDEKTTVTGSLSEVNIQLSEL
ncbi:MAG: carboxypeptidase-like regulatory domain-containing protein [Bacteroidetes bacterium]|nr:carboxypeptidase-like regulatory domain-containing protein [Bacteroidota bacterium]